MSAGAYVACVKECDLSGVVAQAARCLQSCSDRYAQHDPPLGAEGTEGFAGLSTGVSVFLAICLVPLTGLFAGLTLGLLSLDLVGLKILETGGEPKEREYARKIMPVRKQGNLLLCTLLLGNTVINSAISILLADLTTGFIGLLVATFVILVFGEIVPQSICTQKEMGLKIGAHSIWLVKTFMVLLAPIVWPISRALDHCLGRDIGTVYSQEELKRLIDIHVSDPDAQAESGLTCADQKLIIGALEYKDKLVRDVMTSLEQVFMLERSLRLTFQTMLAIYKSGFTRIPVYEGTRQNIVGILYAKDLILVDPDDGMEVSAVLSFRGRNAVHVSETEPLDSVFKLFMTSANHMLLACTADCTVTGLITLEDVMEELIQVAARVDLATFMMMFEHKLSHQQLLSQSEVQAVAAFLSLNIAEFRQLANFELPLQGLISHAEVLEKEVDHHQRGSPTETANAHDGLSSSPPVSSHLTPAGSLGNGTTPRTHLLSRGSRSLQLMHWDDANANVSESGDDCLLLYDHGQPSDAFTLLLQGKACIRTGVEGFELEMGPWSVLGNKALSSPSYVPDFTAVIWPPYRVLRIRKAAYQAALQATHLGPVIAQRARLANQEGVHTARSLPPVAPPLPVRLSAPNSVTDSPASLVLKPMSTPGRLSARSHGSSEAPALPPTSQGINSAADAVRTASPRGVQDMESTKSSAEAQMSLDGYRHAASDSLPIPSPFSTPSHNPPHPLASSAFNTPSHNNSQEDEGVSNDQMPLLGSQKRK